MSVEYRKKLKETNPGRVGSPFNALLKVMDGMELMWRHLFQSANEILLNETLFSYLY